MDVYLSISCKSGYLVRPKEMPEVILNDNRRGGVVSCRRAVIFWVVDDDRHIGW